MTQSILAEGRIFAEKYMFYVLDTAIDMGDAMSDDFAMIGPNYGADDVGPHQFLMVGTRADLNDHWLRILKTDSHPSAEGYDYVACVKFRIESGSLAVECISDLAMTVEIPVGDYSLYVCGRNIDINPSDAESEISDEDFWKIKCEAWDLVFVDSEASNYGELCGTD